MAGSDEAIPGWWLASDGRWYPPADLPSGWIIGTDGRPTPAPVMPPVETTAPSVFALGAFDASDASDPGAEPAGDTASGAGWLGAGAGLGVAPELAASGSTAEPGRRRRRGRAATALAALLVVVAAGGVLATRGGDEPAPDVLGATEARATSTTQLASTSTAGASSSTTVVDPAKLSGFSTQAKAPSTTTSLRIFGGLAPGTGTGSGFVPTTTAPRGAPFAPTTTTTTQPPTTTATPGVPTTAAPGGSTTSSPASATTTTRPTTTTTATTSTSTSTTTTSTTTSTTTTSTTTTTTLPPTTTVPPTTTAAASCTVTSPSQAPREGNSFSVAISSNRPGTAATATVDFSSSSGADRTLTGTTNGSGALTFSSSVSVPGNFGGRTVTITVTIAGTSCNRSFTVAQGNNND